MSSRIPILLYHRIGPRDGSKMDRYTVSPERFRAQLNIIRAEGWNVISLEQYIGGRGASGNQNCVVITFDDGFASNVDHAWPILEKHKFHATTFVVTRQIGGVNAWDDLSMPRYPLLGTFDLSGANRNLSSFFSHSVNHHSLPSLQAKELEREIRQSKEDLEDLTGRSVPIFAYPFGSVNERVRRSVEIAGYRGACTTKGGKNSSRTDPLLLRRVEILESDIGWRLRLKLSTGFNFE